MVSWSRILDPYLVLFRFCCSILPLSNWINSVTFCFVSQFKEKNRQFLTLTSTNIFVILIFNIIYLKSNIYPTTKCIFILLISTPKLQSSVPLQIINYARHDTSWRSMIEKILVSTYIWFGMSHETADDQNIAPYVKWHIVVF